jgi:hypothetical protein
VAPKAAPGVLRKCFRIASKRSGFPVRSAIVKTPCPDDPPLETPCCISESGQVLDRYCLNQTIRLFLIPKMAS